MSAKISQVCVVARGQRDMATSMQGFEGESGKFKWYTPVGHSVGSQLQTRWCSMVNHRFICLQLKVHF